MDTMPVVLTDGGRSAHFKGATGDCVVRSVSIATGLPYDAVYADFKALMGRGNSPRNGVAKPIYHKYLLSLGWRWVPTMWVGQQKRVTLAPNQLPPKGRFVVRLSKHLTAVIDGVIYDSYDPARDGTRCVYGYYQSVDWAKINYGRGRQK